MSTNAADIAALFGPDNKEATPDVPVEHLDYDYVNECSSAKELIAILRVLRSGKEGRYYHLEDHVEKRLLDVLPPDQRKYVLMLCLVVHVRRGGVATLPLEMAVLWPE